MKPVGKFILLWLIGFVGVFAVIFAAQFAGFGSPWIPVAGYVVLGLSLIYGLRRNLRKPTHKR